MIIWSDEPAVQLVALGLLAAEDALYNTVLVVLFVEYLGHPTLVGLAAVDRTASLFDVGDDSHLEQYLAVVV